MNFQKVSWNFRIWWVWRSETLSVPKFQTSDIPTVRETSEPLQANVRLMAFYNSNLQVQTRHTSSSAINIHQIFSPPLKPAWMTAIPWIPNSSKKAIALEHKWRSPLSSPLSPLSPLPLPFAGLSGGSGRCSWSMRGLPTAMEVLEKLRIAQGELPSRYCISQKKNIYIIYSNLMIRSSSI